MNYLSTVMESTYSTAKICDVDEDPETCVPSLELEPGNYTQPSLSSLHLLIFIFFYALFVRWSICPFCTVEYINNNIKCSFISYTKNYPNGVLLCICPKMYFCAKRERESKIIVPPKEMLLLFSIGTFLTNYDVTNRKHHINLIVSNIYFS